MIKRKRFGQHFLIDESVAKGIVNSANLSGNETVVEIGPGKGILTSKLAGLSKRVIAVEVDRQLCHLLKHSLSFCNNITIINANALNYNYKEIAERFKVVSNLPYNISTPLIMKLLENRDNITEMVLMFQREVADRIVAKPGIKSYGTLSILIQYYADAVKLMDVDRKAFRPIPRVDSSVIRITPRKEPLVKVMNENLFFNIVKTSFAHRRKIIRNNLKSMNFSDEFLEQILRETGINPSRRGETLSISEFANIANFLSTQ